MINVTQEEFSKEPLEIIIKLEVLKNQHALKGRFRATIKETQRS